MISQKSALTAIGATLCVVALAGCDQFRLPSRASVSPAQKAACHARAEDIYSAQNKGDIYRSDTQSYGSTTPFSNGGYANTRNEQLSSQYAYQRSLDDCYAVGADPAPATPASKP